MARELHAAPQLAYGPVAPSDVSWFTCLACAFERGWEKAKFAFACKPHAAFPFSICTLYRLLYLHFLAQQTHRHCLLSARPCGNKKTPARLSRWASPAPPTRNLLCALEVSKRMAEVAAPIEVRSPTDDELRRLKAKQDLDWLSQLPPETRLEREREQRAAELRAAELEAEREQRAAELEAERAQRAAELRAAEREQRAAELEAEREQRAAELEAERALQHLILQGSAEQYERWKDAQQLLARLRQQRPPTPATAEGVRGSSLELCSADPTQSVHPPQRALTSPVVLVQRLPKVLRPGTSASPTTWQVRACCRKWPLAGHLRPDWQPSAVLCRWGEEERGQPDLGPLASSRGRAGSAARPRL